MGGGVESLSPEAGRQRGLDQKGAHDVVRRANNPLSLAVLERGIRTRHTQLNTPREEKRMGCVVVELTLIVTLDGLNGETELSGHPSKEVEEGGKGLRLGAQRKSPRVMRKNHQPPPDSIYNQKCWVRRSPQITMNKIKDDVSRNLGSPTGPLKRILENSQIDAPPRPTGLRLLMADSRLKE